MHHLRYCQMLSLLSFVSLLYIKALALEPSCVPPLPPASSPMPLPPSSLSPLPSSSPSILPPLMPPSLLPSSPPLMPPDSLSPTSPSPLPPLIPPYSLSPSPSLSPISPPLPSPSSSLSPISPSLTPPSSLSYSPSPLLSPTSSPLPSPPLMPSSSPSPSLPPTSPPLPLPPLIPPLSPSVSPPILSPTLPSLPSPASSPSPLSPLLPPYPGVSPLLPPSSISPSPSPSPSSISPPISPSPSSILSPPPPSSSPPPPPSPLPSPPSPLPPPPPSSSPPPPPSPLPSPPSPLPPPPPSSSPPPPPSPLPSPPSPLPPSLPSPPPPFPPISPVAPASPIIPSPPLTPSPPPSPPSAEAVEYIDPTLPPLLPAHDPKCSILVLRQDFANTVGAPPTRANYIPPVGCPAPWSRVILELSGSASDIQKDRIAAIWFGGAEILRTTTPLPMAPGVSWHVRKDITRYTALLRKGNFFSMMLENSNATWPGVYTVNVALHFYRGALCGSDLQSNTETTKLNPVVTAHPTIKGLYREPADLVIPISDGAGRAGFWFRVENDTDVRTADVVIPNNTYRAVLEVYVSHHGGDEYWYANPLGSGDFQLRPDGIESAKPNGGFRQAVATIDGRYVGSALPFPVIYPGSINPFFWAPVAAIGAYDHPSYDLELTPFIGLLLDGKPHQFGLTVRDSQPYWLVSANLHLWLDAWSDAVEAGLIRYKAPPLRLSRQADWEVNEGKSEIEGQVTLRFSGWVSSFRGNITTSIRHRIKFKSHVEVEEKGGSKNVEVVSRSRTNVRSVKDHKVLQRAMVDTEAPIEMMVICSNGGDGSRFRKTKLLHELRESRTLIEGKSTAFSTLADRQESEGSMLMEGGGSALWGKGDTKSTYKFRDNKACYRRTVNMVGGKLEGDEQTSACAAVAAS